MDPIRFAIDNPVKVAVGVILLLLFGVLAVVSIPVQLTPNVDPTIITVSTEWTGKSPEEIEREIIEDQEDVLKNISGLVKMTATATQGEAEIELEFKVGKDLQSARVEVSDALREVPDYPDDADEPVITDGEAGPGSPIAWLLLTSDMPGFDVQTLGDLAEDRIKPMLERAEGVSEARVYGGREREVHIQFDPDKVAQRKITFTQLGEALRQENVNVSAGNLKEGRYDPRVRVMGQYDNLEAIRQTIVAYDAAGGPIRIRDIADVDLAFSKRRSFVRSRGELAIAMPVYRQPGTNIMEVMGNLKEAIDQINGTDDEEGMLEVVGAKLEIERNLGSDPEITLRQVYDETGYIEDALALVQSNLIIGGVLAVIALLLFLELGRRPLLVLIATPILIVLMLGVLRLPQEQPLWWTSTGLLVLAGLVVLYIARPTLIIALAIPISVIGTFVVMYGAGRNLNVISLAGLAFAVGMVVDNAIVVLENIDRHLAMGKKRAQAAYDAGREVWGAVLASTLTTLAVFLPVLFIEEEAGQLFRDIALAICGAVTLSLIVAITVIPTAGARLLRERHETKSPLDAINPARLFAYIGRGFSQLIYLMSARHPLGVIGRLTVVGLFTFAALGGAYLLMPPTDYLPRGNKNLVFGIILNPPGYNINTDEELAKIVEDQIRPYWEAKSDGQLVDMGLPPVMDFDFETGTAELVKDVPRVNNYFIVSFNGGMFNGATSVDKENVAPLAPLLSQASGALPGSFGFAAQQSLFGRGASGSRAIEVEISGDSIEEVRDASTQLFLRYIGLYGPMNVQPTPTNFDKPAREFQIQIDRVKAAELGVDVASLGRAVEAMVDGIIIGEYRDGGNSIDILAKSRDGLTYTPDELFALPLAYQAPDGTIGTIPLSAIAMQRRADSPQSIQRIEERRAVTLAVSPPDDVPLEAAEKELRAIEAELDAMDMIPDTLEVNYAGSASKLDDVKTAMLGKWDGWDWDSLFSLGTSRLFIALLVTFLLMAALFESFIYPLVIMFSVPLATIGGFIGLALVRLASPDQQLDTLTMLGFVILIGVVVNNAILLVHQALNFMRGLGEGEGDDSGKMGPREAIRASVRTRIRPIFMTTATSVAGMLPLVLMPGSGSELYRGLGSVVVGGLVVSTLFTLVVVPLLFSLVLDLRSGIHIMLGVGDDEQDALVY
ncbi:MAG: efflux RND transporter permease subunit [Planctomycetota bacterium]